MPTKKKTKKKTKRKGPMTEREWEEFGMRMAEKFGDPERWERRARTGKRKFGLLLFIIGVIWMLSELGYLASIPIWPSILILFALFVMFE